LTPALVLKLLRDHLDVRGFKDIEIIELGNAPLAKSSAGSSVARAVIGSAAEVYGIAPLVYPMDPSSGPVGAVAECPRRPHPWRLLASATPAPTRMVRMKIFALTIFAEYQVYRARHSQARRNQNQDERNN